MEWMRARVSPKRQVTIPQKLFERAGITDEVEFGIKDSYIIIRPARAVTPDYFSDLILEDLINEGYSGTELLHKFRDQHAQLRAAVQALVTESADVALAFTGTGDDQTHELFRDVMDD